MRYAVTIALLLVAIVPSVFASTAGVDIIVGGTEYFPGDDGKVFVELFDATDQPIEGATCRAWIWYPDGTRFVAGAYLNEVERGIYDYDVVMPSIEGVYPVSVECFLNETQGFATLSSVSPYFTTEDGGNLSALATNDNIFYKLNETDNGLLDDILFADGYFPAPGVGVDGGGPSRFWYDDGADEKWDEKGASLRGSDANITFPCGNCSSYTITDITIDVQLERAIAGGDPASDPLHYYLYNYSSGKFVEVGSHGYTVGYQNFQFTVNSSQYNLSEFYNGSHFKVKVNDTVREPIDTKDTHNHVDLLRVTPTLITNQTLQDHARITAAEFVFDYVNGTETQDIYQLTFELSAIYDFNGPGDTEDTLQGFIYNFNTSTWDALGNITTATGIETNYIFSIDGSNENVLQYLNGTNILMKYYDTYNKSSGFDTETSRFEIDLLKLTVEYNQFGIQNTVRGGNEMHVSGSSLLDQIGDIFAGATTWILQLLGFTSNIDQGGQMTLHVFEGNHYVDDVVNIFAQLTYNGTGVDDADCFVDVWYPNATELLTIDEDAAMSPLLDDGMYNLTVTVPDTPGTYALYVHCQHGTGQLQEVFGSASWHIEDRPVYMEMIT